MSVAALEEVEAVLGALADPTRRAALGALAERGSSTATGLATAVPVTRQAVVKHLTVLERAGLVEGRRSGREVRFGVRPERLTATARHLADVADAWDARLRRIKEIAEQGA